MGRERTMQPWGKKKPFSQKGGTVSPENTPRWSGRRGEKMDRGDQGGCCYIISYSWGKTGRKLKESKKEREMSDGWPRLIKLRDRVRKS